MGERARKVLNGMVESRLQQPAPKSHGAITETFIEINRAYPEVRSRVKDTPQWQTLSDIERQINEAALHDDFEGLDRALQAYKRAALDTGHGEAQGNLF